MRPVPRQPQAAWPSCCRRWRSTWPSPCWRYGSSTARSRGSPRSCELRGPLYTAASVTPPQLDLDPYLHDPLQWGASMAHHAELLRACLHAVGARSVVEVGAYAGDLTRVLADWAQGT